MRLAQLQQAVQRARFLREEQQLQAQLQAQLHAGIGCGGRPRSALEGSVAAGDPAAAARTGGATSAEPSVHSRSGSGGGCHGAGPTVASTAATGGRRRVSAAGCDSGKRPSPRGRMSAPAGAGFAGIGEWRCIESSELTRPLGECISLQPGSSPLCGCTVRGAEINKSARLSDDNNMAALEGDAAPVLDVDNEEVRGPRLLGAVGAACCAADVR